MLSHASKFTFGASCFAARSCARSLVVGRLPREVTAAKAVSKIKTGDNVFLHGVVCTPKPLVDALCDRHENLRDVKLYSIFSVGDAPYTDPKYKDSFLPCCFFVHDNTRHCVNAGHADYLPMFLSEIPMFLTDFLNIDCAMIQVSPPDSHGFCSLGPAVDATVAAINNARSVVAQVNPRMPRTHGDGMVHMSQINYVVNEESPIQTVPVKEDDQVTAIERAIGENVAELVPDGATIQCGIGSVPDAVMKSLRMHRELGYHSEMMGDAFVDLYRRGVITNEHKVLQRHENVCTFALGSQDLYDFIDDNPNVQFKECSYTNKPPNIGSNPKVVSINSAIEIDMTGQVCADSFGSYIYSGVGGQTDFLRGATLSEGGKAIIAMKSTTAGGQSRIVPFLKPGAGVVTTRAHAHYVVTEHGFADLHGKSVMDRSHEMIRISAPEHRDTMQKMMREKFFMQPNNWFIPWMKYNSKAKDGRLSERMVGLN